MKIKLWLVALILFTLLGPLTLAEYDTPRLNHGEPIKQVTLVDLDFPPPNLYEAEESLTFTLPKDMVFLMQEGSPVLPYKTQIMTFPLGTHIETITAEPREITHMHLEKKLLYGSPSLPLENQHVLTGGRDKDIHMSSDLFPKDWVVTSTGVGIQNEHHVVFLILHIYPYRYSPQMDTLLHIDTLDIEITYKLPISSRAPPDSYDFLIIAPSEFSSSLTPLVSHKESHGIKTRLVTLPEIYDGIYFTAQGRDDAEKIKYFIKDVIENWGITSTLLVGGRHGGIKNPKWWCPVRYSHLDVNDGEKNFLCDLYFADIYRYTGGEAIFDDWDSNGNGIYGEWTFGGKDIIDMFPDIYIGRLPCRNTFEVDIMVEKIITYETLTYNQDWFQNYVGIGGDTFTGDQWWDGEVTIAHVIDLLTPLGYSCSTLFTSDGTLTGRWDIIDAVSAGCGFLHFEGHGNPISWGNHRPNDPSEKLGMSEDGFIFFKNKDMYPICVVGGCHNSKYDISLLNLLDIQNLSRVLEHNDFGPECFSWWMTRKINGGSIATIGCTSYGYGKPGDSDHDGIFDGLQYRGGFIDIEFFRLYAQQGYTILGHAHTGAITSYLTLFPPMTDKIDGKTVEEWTLFGDPTLKIGGYQ